VVGGFGTVLMDLLAWGFINALYFAAFIVE
jgi:hypothetical protein